MRLTARQRADRRALEAQVVDVTAEARPAPVGATTTRVKGMSLVPRTPPAPTAAMVLPHVAEQVVAPEPHRWWHFGESKTPTVLTPSQEQAAIGGRQGWVSGIPVGGATALNPAQATIAGAVDRKSFLTQLMQTYSAVPWLSAGVDTIARTITAGGLQVVPIRNSDDDTDDGAMPEPSGAVQQIQELFDFCNPYEDIRQLCRRVITDMLIFGDAYVEVTWLLGRPVALWALDAPTIDVLADEHGILTGYHQETDTGRQADFEPHEVIHFRFDSPGGGLYGVSPTQKALLSATTWLFTMGLIKETMKAGDPPTVHIDWPLALPEPERTRFQQKHQVRNRGAKNVGVPLETQGGAVVQELKVNRITDWLETLEACQQQGLSELGVPPSKVAIIEAGNLGGGTGTSQDKTFRVNTCGPIEELVLEKFTYSLFQLAYGVYDWKASFGQVDWRDDKTIEDIRDTRIRNGTWTVNRARNDANEPSVDGGDQAVIIDRQNMVLVKDLADMSKATIASKAGTAALPPGNTVPPAAGDPASPLAGAPAAPAGGDTGGEGGPAELGQRLAEAWRIGYDKRLRAARKAVKE